MRWPNSSGSLPTMTRKRPTDPALNATPDDPGIPPATNPW
jgi:hypothetical protein